MQSLEDILLTSGPQVLVLGASQMCCNVLREGRDLVHNHTLSQTEGWSLKFDPQKFWAALNKQYKFIVPSLFTNLIGFYDFAAQKSTH